MTSNMSRMSDFQEPDQNQRGVLACSAPRKVWPGQRIIEKGIVKTN